MKFRNATTAQVEAAIDRQMDRDIDAASDDTDQRLDEMCHECDDDRCPLSAQFAGEPQPEQPSWKRERLQRECASYKDEPGYDQDDCEPRSSRFDYF